MTSNIDIAIMQMSVSPTLRGWVCCVVGHFQFGRIATRSSIALNSAVLWDESDDAALNL